MSFLAEFPQGAEHDSDRIVKVSHPIGFEPMTYRLEDVETIYNMHCRRTRIRFQPLCGIQARSSAFFGTCESVVSRKPWGQV